MNLEDMKRLVNSPVKIYCRETKRYIDIRACIDCTYRKTMGCVQWEDSRN